MFKMKFTCKFYVWKCRQIFNLEKKKTFSGNLTMFIMRFTTAVFVFVFQPTSGMSMAPGPFKEGLGAGPQPTRARHFKKYLGPRRHSPKEGSLTLQAINLTPNPKCDPTPGEAHQTRGSGHAINNNKENRMSRRGIVVNIPDYDIIVI